MISRRIFMQGTAVAVGVASPLVAGIAAQAKALPAPTLVIDSLETPSKFVGSAQTLRLSGSQLERFEQLRAVFSAGINHQVEAHLDNASQLLLETALNAAGTSVRNVVQIDGVLNFTAQSV